MQILAITVVLSTVCAIAIPDPQGDAMAAISSCVQVCWNDSAVSAECDPNTDDECLCGAFLEDVTTCVSQACSTSDNLAAASILEPACGN
ncbi:hypothetical protein BDV96DRAFT_648316 [Lophiotrema nucula]|uniref:CFEM domain-containing protein n=1 Tax=Lophiotrema nucula TaxID=690887 RepID=A0A6A5Z1L3_9PLEO|nr:hypothetical protein BDV96DRAFT_648316 [Lophiotrema nucula]